MRFEKIHANYILIQIMERAGARRDNPPTIGIAVDSCTPDPRGRPETFLTKRDKR
jgi:hypothetical protein